MTDLHHVVEDGDFFVVSDERGVRGGVALAVLRREIEAGLESDTQSLWTFEDAFGVHASLAVLHDIKPTWIDMARWMASFKDARAWRRAMRAVDRKSPRRTCDRLAGIKDSPTNIRTFKRTWRRITKLLLPLAEAGVNITPIHETASRVQLLEVCGADVDVERGAASSFPDEAYVEGWIVGCEQLATHRALTDSK